MTGTWLLVRLILRRDRIRLPLWVLLAVGLVAGIASSVKNLYAAQADRDNYAETVGANASAAVYSGPGLGTDTLGGILLKESAATTLILVILFTITAVVRHTRAEEESGRAELVGSAVVGRYARLMAPLIVVGVTTLLIGVLVFVSLLGYGLPASGALAYGLAMTLLPWVFAGVAAVCAQVFEHARTANGAAIAIFGLAFIVRGVGDSTAVSDPGSALADISWFSPLGWLYQLRPFAGERWWVLLLPLALAAVLVVTAALASTRRDVAAGLIPPRLGRPEATGALSSVWALVWRLQRGSVVAWTIGVAVVAVVFGSIANDITDIVGDNQNTSDVITRLGGASSLVDSYLGWLLGITAIAAAAFAVSAVVRLRSEETSLRVEPLLATGVKRWQLVASHLVVAVVGAAVMLLAAGAVVGLAHGARTGDTGGELARVLRGEFGQLPAVLLLIGAAVALIGLLPRFTLVAWALVAVALLIAQLGAVFQLSQAVMNLSPFTHVPRALGQTPSAVAVSWLLGIAVVLVAAGVVGFRRRDIART